MKISEVGRRLRAAHGSRVTLVESSYVGFKKRATFIDQDYGEWVALVYAVCRGGQHPQRARAARQKPIAAFKAELESAHGSLVQIRENSYRGLCKKATFVDRDYGEWSAYPQNVLRGKGHPTRAAECRAAARALSEDDVKAKLQKVHSGHVTLIGPYRGMLEKTAFHDEAFGDFEALPANVIHKKTRHPDGASQRREQAFLRRFGARHPMQHDGFFHKFQKLMLNRYLETHWKTGEELVCTPGWELKVVRWLNAREVDFHWQPKAFTMPSGSTYRPDVYIVPWDLWVEIKGYMTEKAQEKWTWFHQNHPNSELWDKSRLHDLGIL